MLLRKENNPKLSQLVSDCCNAHVKEIGALMVEIYVCEICYNDCAAVSKSDFLEATETNTKK